MADSSTYNKTLPNNHLLWIDLRKFDMRMDVDMVFSNVEKINSTFARTKPIKV